MIDSVICLKTCDRYHVIMKTMLYMYIYTHHSNLISLMYIYIYIYMYNADYVMLMYRTAMQYLSNPGHTKSCNALYVSHVVLALYPPMRKIALMYTYANGK